MLTGEKFANYPVGRTPVIGTILTSKLSVYHAAIKSGDFDFSSLVAESGLLCARCRASDCARLHAVRHRKLVRDLLTGEVFEDLPILRAGFCDGSTKSLMPAELWRGRATVTSVLTMVARAITGGVEHALEWAMQSGDGDETVSERTARRWLRRAEDRVPVATAALDFSPAADSSGAGKLANFLAHLHPRHLLQLRRRWGHSLLDLPSPPKPPRTATRPRPGHQNPAAPHDPPSRYLPRGTRSRLARRGRPPDE